MKAIGMSRTPRPSTRRARFRYMRPDAARIWPHARLRGTRSGATGVQVARTAAKIARPRIVPRKISVGRGFRRSRMSAREPAATAVQKKSVELVPNKPPVGTA